MLQAKLKVVGGRHHGRLIPLTTKKFLIGREQDCQLRPNSELVSRHHCVFAVDDYSVRIRDLGSTNGTFVNDRRVRGEVSLNSGDRIRVGKLDFELVVGETAPTNGMGGGDSAQLQPVADPAASETAPLGTNDTSFEIPVPPSPVETGPVDTGSSIISTESLTPVPTAPAAVPANQAVGDSTVVWTPPATPGYPPEMYPPMGMPYPQMPYQPGYPYMGPTGGYQPQFPYPQMPYQGYPGMYPQPGPHLAPQMGGPQMGVYPPPAPSYAPTPPAALPEPEIEEPPASSSALNVKLPDPKTTGAKAPPAPPAPPPQAAVQPAPAAAPEGAAAADAAGEKKPQPAAVKPSEGAADILKKYTQRRPV